MGGLTSGRFGEREFEGTPLRLLKFELKSLAWRSFSRKKRVATRPLLQIGSGTNPIPGFENVDFFENKFWRSRQVGHDLKFPLSLADDAFEGVYTKHTIEHLYPRQAGLLLREIYRVLKLDGVLRRSVPDLASHISLYDGELRSPEFARFSSGC